MNRGLCDPQAELQEQPSTAGAPCRTGFICRGAGAGGFQLKSDTVEQLLAVAEAVDSDCRAQKWGFVLRIVDGGTMLDATNGLTVVVFMLCIDKH